MDQKDILAIFNAIKKGSLTHEAALGKRDHRACTLTVKRLSKPP